MTEAVSAQIQVAKAVVEIEREAVSLQLSADNDLGAAQLILTALFQKLGAQGKQQRLRKPMAVPEQQLLLFGMLAATD